MGVRTNPEVFGMTYAQTQCRSEMSIPECIREVSRPVHHQQMEFPSMVRESRPILPRGNPPCSPWSAPDRGYLRHRCQWDRACVRKGQGNWQGATDHHPIVWW